MTYQEQAKKQAARWQSYAVAARMLEALPALAQQVAQQAMAPGWRQVRRATVGTSADRYTDKLAARRRATAERHNAGAKARAVAWGHRS